ncbi:hypothetical protein J6TS1_50080 [Siminovitchia terrae]|uniref:Uncharacterized protein n=1 Tax=Siminovitchia terrae TaxID=1914933 RepID=A0ABQ4L4C8_SIMTE|nr:hypothetical protein [Siminovitchia terrae]GIN99138.1 hypothetical protein J6TS1_50080 [Siminovitchia terrae]
MDESNIKKTWYELERYFGPAYFGQGSKLKNTAEAYAQLVLEADDKERIKFIGRKHLKKVANKELEGKQFDVFLQHVIQFERFKDIGAEN